MIILSSDRPISVKIDEDNTVLGSIIVKLSTDLNAHARLCDVPLQELTLLLNTELSVMIDKLMPQIESLTDKYYKRYSE